MLVEENGRSDIAWPTDETEEKEREGDGINADSMEESGHSNTSQTAEEEFNDESFHCSDLLHMNFDSLDPSLALGFICKFEDDFNDLIIQLKVCESNQ